MKLYYNRTLLISISRTFLEHFLNYNDTFFISSLRMGVFSMAGVLGRQEAPLLRLVSLCLTIKKDSFYDKTHCAVFQTGMVGYPESLTDPSYRWKRIAMSY